MYFAAMSSDISCPSTSEGPNVTGPSHSSAPAQCVARHSRRRCRRRHVKPAKPDSTQSSPTPLRLVRTILANLDGRFLRKCLESSYSAVSSPAVLRDVMHDGDGSPYMDVREIAGAAVSGGLERVPHCFTQQRAKLSSVAQTQGPEDSQDVVPPGTQTTSWRLATATASDVRDAWRSDVMQSGSEEACGAECCRCSVCAFANRGVSRLSLAISPARCSTGQSRRYGLRPETLWLVVPFRVSVHAIKPSPSRQNSPCKAVSSSLRRMAK